ncbi:amiloride-sensitive sodium channel subunit gamma [Bombina bombina]|uniref:amiloride-sensitive sodium channel subunit gamma n=1 Tax=Bombina bombina TaxID=8345 RepID=UPI00235B25C3|nr:amiloride-sensitive sodium channel subunit gamma [Bombina bombina]XP_053550800.1 amiloride-sensitive sodium channel subunit gamma [Bombina bombina]
MYNGAGKKLTQKLKKTLPVTGPQAPTLYELMQWYCLTTNTHGCRRIVVSKGRLRRWIWISLTLTAVALVFWQCALLIMSYNSVTVSITVNFQKLVFPAVTICNMNAYRYSKIKSYLKTLDEETSQALKDLYGFEESLSRRRRDVEPPKEEMYFNKLPLYIVNNVKGDQVDVTAIPSRKRSRMNAKVMSRNSNTVSFRQENVVGFKLCDPNNKTDCTVFTFSSGVNAIQEWYRLHYMNILAQIPMEEKIAMGYSADDFLVTCFFDGLSCDSRNFTLFHHALYGNCYTFNSIEKGDLLVSSLGGMEYGLKVVLYIDEDEYNPYLITAAGAKILVHDQDEYPFIEDVGTEVETALETAIGMQLTESSKLSSPYSDCTLDGSDVPVSNLYNKKYTLQICLQSCFQLVMVQECGCAHYDQPLPDGAKYCNYKDNPSWIYCYFKLHKKFVQEMLGCQSTCRESCSFKEWELTRSQAKWPSINSEEWMLRVLTWELGDKLNKNLTKQDLANLNIYYQDLNIKSISESPTYNIVTLLSNFGGQLGLWLSCSMVCVLEIFEIFLIDSFWVVLRQRWQKFKKWWKNRKEDQTQQTPDIPVPTMTGHDNPICTGDEDPPTFNTALQLPQAQHLEVPRTPPPMYNSLRIQEAFVHEANDSDDTEYL